RPAERHSRRSPVASPSSRRATRRRRGTAAPPAHRARPAHSARRRSGRSPARSCRAHLVLDPRRVFLVRLRVGRELDDPLLLVERIAAPDVHVRPVDLDDVVTRPPLPRSREEETVPALTTKRSSSRQAYGTCLWPARTRSTWALWSVSSVSPASLTMLRSRPVPGTG